MHEFPLLNKIREEKKKKRLLFFFSSIFFFFSFVGSRLFFGLFFVVLESTTLGNFSCSLFCFSFLFFILFLFLVLCFVSFSFFSFIFIPSEELELTEDEPDFDLEDDELEDDFLSYLKSGFNKSFLTSSNVEIVVHASVRLSLFTSSSNSSRFSRNQST